MCECCEEIEWCKEHYSRLKARVIAEHGSNEIGCKKVDLNYCPECGKKL